MRPSISSGYYPGVLINENKARHLIDIDVRWSIFDQSLLIYKTWLNKLVILLIACYIIIRAQERKMLSIIFIISCFKLLLYHGPFIFSKQKWLQLKLSLRTPHDCAQFPWSWQNAHAHSLNQSSID